MPKHDDRYRSLILHFLHKQFKVPDMYTTQIMYIINMYLGLIELNY